MGQDQSTASGQRGSDDARPPDFYELLEVTEEATADEIKVRVPSGGADFQKSYRRLAVSS